MSSPETREVDVAIIGAGTAGLTARRAALAAGAERVLMIEGGPYGTTCARVGCMPSKLLIAAAEAAHGIDHAALFGISNARYEVDGAAVMRRVQAERDRFAGFVVDAVNNMPEDQKLRGWARFVGPTSLLVAPVDEGASPVRVEAKSIVIAAGTDAWIPSPFHGLGDRLLTNENVFDLPTVPRSIAVIGTGVIGLELGQAFARLGARTALFNRNARVGPLRDPRLHDLSREILGAELDLQLNVEDLNAERKDDGVELRWTDAHGEAHVETFEYILAATGRRPNFERLGLDELDLVLDDAGRPKFDPRTMQIGERPLFLAGDVNNERTLLHEAADEGRIAGENAALFPDVRAKVRRTPLSIVFSDPNIATVGTPIPDLDPSTHVFGEVDYSDQGRARVMGQNRGAVRIWGSLDCGVLVAAEMVGPRVEHTAHLLAWAIGQRMTVEDALGMPFYHPVVEEGIRTALRDLSRAIKHGGGRVDCTPGV